MTTDTLGGVWVYSYELCKALEQHNVEVHLAAMGAWPSENQEQLFSDLKNVTLYKSDYKLEWMQNPWEDVENARKWLNSIYQTVHPDLIHLNNYVQAEEDWDCPVVSVFHSCVNTWWQAVKSTNAPKEWDTYAEIVQQSLNNSDVVVAPTEAILEKAVETHGISSATKVIPNGRSLDFSNSKKEEFILCTGRIWDEAKNLQLISEIAKELPWKVYIAGDNCDPNSGKEIEIENVEFLGNLNQDEIKDWMERASIFVSPTKYEPFGLAILEAAMAGCALAVSDLDTLQENWNDTALFFNPENASEAKEKLMILITDANLRKEFSAKAKERSQFFNSEKMAAAYHEVYQELLTPKVKPKLVNV